MLVLFSYGVSILLIEINQIKLNLFVSRNIFQDCFVSYAIFVKMNKYLVWHLKKQEKLSVKLSFKIETPIEIQIQ